MCMRLQFRMVVGTAFSLFPLRSTSSSSSSLAILLHNRNKDVQNKCLDINAVLYSKTRPKRLCVFTWLERSVGDCRPCAVFSGVCDRSVEVHTCPLGGYWSNTAPVRYCCFPLIGWREGDSPAYWPMHSGTLN